MPAPNELRAKMEEAFALLAVAQSSTDKAKSILGTVYHGLAVNQQSYNVGVTEGLRRAGRAVADEGVRALPSRDPGSHRYCGALDGRSCSACCAGAHGACLARCDFWAGVKLDGVPWNARDYVYVTDDPKVVPGARVVVPTGASFTIGVVSYVRPDRPSIPGVFSFKRIERVLP